MSELHEGHRQRLRDRILNNGAMGVKNHEIVEFLLFYVVPRRDMNPLAHRLINRFGNLRNLFSAPPSEMMAVEGVTESIARWLSLVGRAVLRYEEPEARPLRIVNRRDARLFLSSLCARSPAEDCWLLCLNAAGCLTCMLPLDAPGGWNAPTNLRRAVSFALGCRAHVVLIAQRRQDAEATGEDARATQALAHAFAQQDIALVEHVVFDQFAQRFQYLTHPEPLRAMMAEPSDLLEHWMDEE